MERAGLEQELLLRSGPLRQQWEARGPGMLRQLNDPFSIPSPDEVDVHVVFPVRGGGGLVHEGEVYMEGVLANPIPSLPEVVRLAWLISQLSAPADMLPHDRLLATIIPVLKAAEYVELIRYDVEAVATALAAWHVSDDRRLAQRLYSP